MKNFTAKNTSGEVDLISVGDSTIDAFIKIHEASIECDLNKKDCKICVPYGSKIPVDEIDFGVAGNAANVAIGTNKLGLKTAIYTNIGDDDNGTRIKEVFEKQGIVMDYVVLNKGKKSNLSVVLTFQGERTIFVYHQDWYYKMPSLPRSEWLYLTSMAITFTNSTIMSDICSYVDKTHAKLVFSPGTYQLKANIKRFPRILEMCELLIVNLEEARKILNLKTDDDADIKNILQDLMNLGPKNVVITDGANGSYASDGQKFLKAGIVHVPVTEKTGAGDAYSSAYVAALSRNLPMEEAMVWGAINSSAVISRITTQSGQLSLKELLDKRSELSELEAVAL